MNVIIALSVPKMDVFWTFWTLWTEAFGITSNDIHAWLVL